MKLRRNKKGFTIVELVIVIAVIGVLAAILIPTFINLTNKANKASDESLVKNLNTALAMQEQEPGDTKNNTMNDAVEDLKEYGYLLPNLVTKSDDKLLWNQETNRFILEDRDADEISKYAKTSFWRIQNNDDYTDGFSIYAGVGFTDTTVDVAVGFDAGSHYEIETVNYTNTVVDQKVRIRTAGGTLNIGTDAAVAKGKITHYGTLNEAIIYTTNNSFHTHGKISSMDLKAGKAVAEDKGYVALVKAAEGTEIQEVDSGVFYIPSNAVVSDIDSTVASSIGYVSDGDSYVVDTTTEAGQTRAQTLASIAYEIGSKFDLIAFRDAVNAGQDFSQITVAMTDDIDMSEYHWLAPIGTKEKPYTGTFDGQKHKIINLSNGGATTLEQFTSITSQTTGSIFGLFGYITGNVKTSNLTLENVLANIPDGLAVGALISGPKSGAKCNLVVENITVTGAISAKEKTGGLIGYGANYGTASGSSCSLTNCYNYASVTTSGDRAAGILSCDGGYGTLNMVNCHNYGNIKASTYAAGMVANLNKAQSMSQSYSKSQDQIWRDVITGPSYSYSNCTNEGVITATDANGIIATLFLDKNTLPDAFNIADNSLNTDTIKRNILAYYNYVGSNVDWESYDKYGILAGLAYDLNLEGDYAAFVGDCHAKTIGDAAKYQYHVDKSLVINVKKDFDTVDIHGSVNFENHSGNQINVKTNDTLTLSNGTLAKIKINNADARVTLVNMVITGTANNQSEQADIYLQTGDVLSIVSGTYSFDPTSYLAQGSTAAVNGNGTWTVTANN